MGNKFLPGQNVGRVAVLGDGHEVRTDDVNAVDSQLIDQLKWTADTICSVYPRSRRTWPASGRRRRTRTSNPLIQPYYSQCLQSLIAKFERSLDAGLELATGLGTEFDIDDLIWMDHGDADEGGARRDRARRVVAERGAAEVLRARARRRRRYAVPATTVLLPRRPGVPRTADRSHSRGAGRAGRARPGARAV